MKKQLKLGLISIYRLYFEKESDGYISLLYNDLKGNQCKRICMNIKRNLRIECKK